MRFTTKRLSGFASGLALAGVLVFCSADTNSCNGVPAADQIQNLQQRNLTAEGAREVGMPAITHFRERKMMKDIYEMRDRGVNTYTYLGNDLQGKVGDKLCDSIGMPIPGGTEFTNPGIVVGVGQDGVVLPQADPNTLFPPSTSDGTYIMCINPKNPNEVGAVYSEPKLITSPFPLK